MDLAGRGGTDIIECSSIQEDFRYLKAVGRGPPDLAPEALTALRWFEFAEHSSPPSLWPTCTQEWQAHRSPPGFVKASVQGPHPTLLSTLPKRSSYLQSA